MMIPFHSNMGRDQNGAPPNWMLKASQKLPNKGSPGPSWLTQGIVAVSGFAVGGDAMASAKVDSNVLIGLQGCKDQHSVNRLGINRKSAGKFVGDSWKIKFKFKCLVWQM